MKLPGLKGECEPPDRVEFNEAGVPTYFWTMDIPPAPLSSMVMEFGEWSATAQTDKERESMGFVCEKHERYVPDGEGCPYCGPDVAAGWKQYMAPMAVHDGRLDSAYDPTVNSAYDPHPDGKYRAGDIVRVSECPNCGGQPVQVLVRVTKDVELQGFDLLPAEVVSPYPRNVIRDWAIRRKS